jgi:O-acetyl-ADP-ribose deacetylase (regulator of RNase III)
MPIVKEIKGDLLEAPQPFIAHGVNCKGLINPGLGRKMNEKWPSSLDKYQDYCNKYNNDPKMLLGVSLSTYEEDDKKVLFHIFTQEDVGVDGRQINYGALAKGFISINDSLKYMHDVDQENNPEETIPMPELSIPKIGSGLGGGDWAILREIIDICTPDISIVIYCNK